MHPLSRHLRQGRASALALAVSACGGAATDAPDGSTLRTCTIPAGSYVQHFTLQSGGSDCANIPDQTVTIAEDEAITGTEVTTGTGFGLTEAGPDCTSSADSETCTFTTSCTTAADASIERVSTSFTFDGAVATGERATNDSEIDGAVLSFCNYTITMNGQ